MPSGWRRGSGLWLDSEEQSSEGDVSAEVLLGRSSVAISEAGL